MLRYAPFAAPFRCCPVLLVVAGLVLVYAKLWAWYGGGSWGPRFVVFAAVPSSLLVAAWLRRDDYTALGYLITRAVLFLSSWVALCGLVEDPNRLGKKGALGPGAEQHSEENSPGGHECDGHPDHDPPHHRTQGRR